MKKGDPYTCAHCGGEFLCGVDDEEAIKELNEDFPGVSVEDSAVICDDCHKQLVVNNQEGVKMFNEIMKYNTEDRDLHDFAGQAMSALISRGMMAQIGIAQGLNPKAPDTEVKISRIACLTAWKIARMMLETKKEAGL